MPAHTAPIIQIFLIVDLVDVHRKTLLFIRSLEYTEQFYFCGRNPKLMLEAVADAGQEGR